MLKCGARTKKGHRCKRNAKSNGLCLQHKDCEHVFKDEEHTDVEDDGYSTDVGEKLSKKDILKSIQFKIKEVLTPNYLKELKTVNGNTQKIERTYIDDLEKIFSELDLTYNKANSQGSKDFQNINDTGLNIEVKKTDSFNIMCNDTCPNKDIEYLIIFTGKEYKKLKNIEPQIIFINGADIIKQSDWIEEFKIELENFKDKWCRGENKKNLKGILNTYIRPTYQFDIKDLLIK